MTDPFHDLFRDAVRADAAPVPLEGLVARARRRRVLLVAGPALAVALIAGGSVAALQSGSAEAGPEQLLVTAEPTVSESVSASPSVVASETPTVAPTAPSAGAGPSTPTTRPAPVTTSPVLPTPAAATTAPTDAPPPVTGSLAVAISTDSATAKPGQPVRLTATITNGHDRAITLRGGDLYVAYAYGPAGPTTLTGRLLAFRQHALGVSPGGADFPQSDLSGTRIPAGGSYRVTEVWTAETVNGSWFDGEVEVRGGVVYYVDGEGATSDVRVGSPVATRAHLAAPDPLEHRASGTTSLRVTGGDATRITPVQVLDVALADEGFAAAVEAGDPARCAPGDYAARLSHYDDPNGSGSTYSAQVCTDGEQYSYSAKAVDIDPDTGEVSDVRSFSLSA